MDSPWRVQVHLPKRQETALPIPLLKRICSFLPTQADVYRVCFLNKDWKTAASAVLWERPNFLNPDAFKLFFEILNLRPSLAFGIQHLHLCLPDLPKNGSSKTPSPAWIHPTRSDATLDTSFIYRPWSFANVDRHKQMNITTVADPNMIAHLLKSCERLQSLCFYGWNMTQPCFTEMAPYLEKLQKLHMIGYDRVTWEDKSRSAIYSLLPQLTSLILDGQEIMTANLSRHIALRCKHLTQLQFSLSNVNDPKVLWTLVDAPGCVLGQLQDLTLTDAPHLGQQHVERLLKGFAQLRHFRLQGTITLSATVLPIILESCPRLETLGIRQAPDASHHGLDDPSAYQYTEAYPHLRTLVLENFFMDDDAIDSLAFCCPYIRTLALTNVGNEVSSSIVGNWLSKSDHLRHVGLVGCSFFNSRSLSLLPCSSMFTLAVDHCGTITPSDVYNLCCRTTRSSNNLRCIMFHGYPDLMDSPVGDHAVHQRCNDYNLPLILDEHAIDALSHSFDIELSPSFDLAQDPDSRLLTGWQLVQLARALDMPVDKLLVTIDNLPAPFSRLSETLPPAAVPSRLVDQDRGILRPETPARWNIRHSSLARHTFDVASTPSSSSRTMLWEMNGDDSQEGDDEAQDDMDESIDNSDDIATTAAGHGLERSDEQHLKSHVNGYGHHKEDIGWHDNIDDLFATDDEPPEDQLEIDAEALAIEPDHQQPHVEDLSAAPANVTLVLGGWGSKHKDLPWSKTKSGVAGHSAKPMPKRKNKTNRGGLKRVSNDWHPITHQDAEKSWQQEPLEQAHNSARRNMRSLGKMYDDWGAAKQIVPWNETNPFVSDVLENQEKTQFWQQLDNGEWAQLAPHANDLPDITQRQPPLKTSPAWAMQDVLLSDDDSVDLDEEDGIILKAEPTPMRHATAAGSSLTPTLQQAPTSRPTSRNLPLRSNSSGRHPTPRRGSANRRTSHQPPAPPLPPPTQSTASAGNMWQVYADNQRVQQHGSLSSSAGSEPAQPVSILDAPLIDTSDGISSSIPTPSPMSSNVHDLMSVMGSLPLTTESSSPNSSPLALSTDRPSYSIHADLLEESLEWTETITPKPMLEPTEPLAAMPSTSRIPQLQSDDEDHLYHPLNGHLSRNESASAQAVTNDVSLLGTHNDSSPTSHPASDALFRPPTSPLTMPSQTSEPSLYDPLTQANTATRVKLTTLRIRLSNPKENYMLTLYEGEFPHDEIDDICRRKGLSEAGKANFIENLLKTQKECSADRLLKKHS
ncbi:hypothetical protein DM01DRAFT_1405618 [Hesseltinella vesiculosa]|uniref:F-box domain-containing protein n=1 Tax=Hesseltinella vesiculosa TaxID=101127 RepID=A0A1X2GQJ6_9FUNG|nr:hypothetical protein DM01DRAFT_1405618 [Hesseltinella vesiculosa]